MALVGLHCRVVGSGRGGVMGAVMQDRIARYVALIERSDTLDIIGQRVAEGESLIELCKSWDVPHGRVLTWLMADLARYQVYLRALEVHAHTLVGETVGLADAADPTAVGKASLQVNTRFRVAKHHAPALYAEKVEVKHSGTVTFTHALQAIAQRKLAAKREPEAIDVTPQVVRPEREVL